MDHQAAIIECVVLYSKIMIIVVLPALLISISKRGDAKSVSEPLPGDFIIAVHDGKRVG